MRYTVEPYDPHVSKSIIVNDRETDVRIEFDYDDVNHAEVERELQRIVAVLNYTDAGQPREWLPTATECGGLCSCDGECERVVRGVA